MNIDKKIVISILKWSNHLDNPFQAQQQTVRCIKNIKQVCFSYERKRILEAIKSLHYYEAVEEGEDCADKTRYSNMGDSVLLEDIQKLLGGK